MLSRLTQASIAHRAVVALLTVLIVAGGVFSLSSLKQELFPKFASPQSTVVTAVPGVSPEVIDKQVTLPLSRVLEQVEGVDSVTATSSSGVSVISLATDYNLDQDKLAADIEAAIDSVSSELPSDTEPKYSTGGVDDLAAMTLTVSSDLSPAELRQRLANTAVPELRGVDGVQDVTVSGGTTKRITVTPNANQIAARGLSVDAITQALTENGTTLAAGSIVEEGEIVGVQVGSALTSVEDIENLPLLPAADDGSLASGPGSPDSGQDAATTDQSASSTTGERGRQVLLGEVAQVAVTDDPATSLTRVNGEPALSVQIRAVSEADLVGLSHAVNDVLPDMENDLGQGSEIVVASDQAPFISESLNHLAIEGGLGLLFAVLVILLFLRSARPTVVTAISIPLSILVTFIGLYLWGYSLNMFTLGALTIAIGRVVDDSIVVIENIKRHMGHGERKHDAIVGGTREVAAAITGSTLATVLVFVPITLVGGFVGQLFRPFALTVTIAMLASLVIALTIIPVLSYWFLKEGAVRNVDGSTEATRPDRTDDPADKVLEDDGDARRHVGADSSPQRPTADEDEQPNLLQRYYIPILRWTMRKPLVVIVPAVVLLGGSLALTPRLGVEFLGDTGETTVTVSQTFDSSLALDEVTARISAAEDVMKDVPGVADIVVTANLAGSGGSDGTGGGPGDDDASGHTNATYTIATTSDADPSAVADDLEDTLARLPEADSIAVGDSSSSASGDSVDVAITSTDESGLNDSATQVVQALADVPHTTDVSNDLAADQPTLQVKVDRAKAATYGLTEQAVTGLVASAMSPDAVTAVTVDGTELSVYVAGPAVSTQEELNALPLAGDAASPQLSDVATVEEVSGPASFNRFGTDLVATVSLTPEAGELGNVQSEIEKRLDSLDLPDGVEVSIGGVAEQQTEAFTQLGLSMLVAVGLIFILLVGILRSMVQPLILMISIPFAAIGGISLLFVTGTPLGVAAMIGMLMLIGIVVTNAIVLMDLINQYRRSGQTVRDAILHGAGRRVRPIVMTALATIFALMPMATGITGGSGFISRGLAIVVIGGLVSSTALTLLLVPAIYQIVEGRHERRQERRGARHKDRTHAEETAPAVVTSAGQSQR